VSDHPHESGSGQPSSGVTETSYKDHRVTYQEDEERFELWIDGRSLAHMVARVAPNQYYSHLLPFMEYSSPEAMAQALIDRKGEAWIDEGGEPEHEQGGSHDEPQQR
jgi:hypothetical protein